MTGPENYREATALLEGGCDHGCVGVGCAHEKVYLARAQVCATLALAAAVIAGPASVMRRSDREKWEQAIDPDAASEREVTR